MTDANQTWSLPIKGYARPPLSLNVPIHHMKAHTIKSSLREVIGWQAVAAKIPHLERGRIVLVWYVADARRRDPHNFTTTLKPLVDGIVDAGVFVDDDYMHVQTDIEIVLDKEKGPSLVLRIEDRWLS